MDRLRAQEINQMCEDDKSMHIFYTLEEIEDVVKSLQKRMRTDDPFLGQRIVQLENIIGNLSDIESRVRKFHNSKLEVIQAWSSFCLPIHWLHEE